MALSLATMLANLAIRAWRWQFLLEPLGRPTFGSAFRATAAEKVLEGKAGTAEDVKAAAALIADGVEANSDLHASSEYRRHVGVVYAARALVAVRRREAFASRRSRR